MTGAELQTMEQKLGFPLPAYYRATMMAYPFSDYEYTANYFLADRLKTVIKNNSRCPTIEGISRIFFVGGNPEPEGERYFVDAAKVESTVYALDPESGKHSIKAKSWDDFLEFLRADIKDLEEDIAAEHAQSEAARAHPKSIWKKDFGPWLEPVIAVLLTFNGITILLKHEYRYQTWEYHGATAEFAGILMLLGAYLLFRGRLWRNRSWDKWTALDKSIGAVVGAGFLFFIALRWISVL